MGQIQNFFPALCSLRFSFCIHISYISGTLLSRLCAAGRKCFCPVWSVFGTRAGSNSHIQREQPPFCSWHTVPGCSHCSPRNSPELFLLCHRPQSLLYLSLRWCCPSPAASESLVCFQKWERNAERFSPQLYNFLILEWVASSVLTRQSGRIPQSECWTFLESWRPCSSRGWPHLLLTTCNFFVNNQFKRSEAATWDVFLLGPMLSCEVQPQCWGGGPAIQTWHWPQCSHLILFSLSSSKPSCLTSWSHQQNFHLDTLNMGLEEFRSHTSWLSFIIYIMYLMSISCVFKTALMVFSCRGGGADSPVLAAGYLLKQLPAAFCSGRSASSKQAEMHQLFSACAHNHVSRRSSAQTLMNFLFSGLCWQGWQHWW